MQLMHYPLCPHSRSVRLALGELRLDAALVEEKPWMWRPEFLAVNPAGDLPVLCIDGGTPVCGAYAISEYLADIRADHSGDGHGPPLFPGDADERAEVRRLVGWFHTKCDREVTREFLHEKYYAHVSGGPRHAPDSDNLRALTANLRYHLKYVGYLADHRRWLAGEELSFADLAAAGHLSALDYLGLIDWDEHSAARSWYVRMKSRPAFQPLLADLLPGWAPPPHYADLDF
jgi:glutathione S-transferase